MTYLLVFLGGGLGAALRHLVNRLAFAAFGPALPVGTLFVNVAGGFFMGLLAALFLAKGGGDQALRLFLVTGLLGGFTTFSAFSLESALMWQRGEWAALAAYAIGSVVLSVGALFLGMATMRGLS